MRWLVLYASYHAIMAETRVSDLLLNMNVSTLGIALCLYLARHCIANGDCDDAWTVLGLISLRNLKFSTIHSLCTF